MDSYTAISTGLSLDCLKEFSSDITVYDRTHPQDCVSRIGDADMIFVNKTFLTREIIEACKNVEYIGIFATGYNMVDLEACRERGIVVTNVPGYSSSSVAQLTFSLILHLMFLVSEHDKFVRDGKWVENDTFCYYDPRISELAGKTLGLIGFGGIGKQVARIAAAFDMKVLVYSRTVYDEYENDGLQFTDIDSLYAKSDIISLHVPLFPETAKMINAESIKKMKDGAIIINTARGAILDENAVAAGLNSGKLGGAGLDVVAVEPILYTNPLLTAKNCVITPHIAWSTTEARARLIEIVCENVKAYLGGNPQNNVSR